MEDEEELHRCVTQFMFDTCRFTTTEHATISSLLIDHSKAVYDRLLGDTEFFHSGSSAEFYINPLLSCIDDIDVMFCLNGWLAVPYGQTPSTELPSHFPRVVSVYEIIDSHEPGYVYLHPSCTLEKNNEGHYVVVRKENSKIALELLPRSYYLINTPSLFDRYIYSIATTRLCHPHIQQRLMKHILQQHNNIYTPHGPAMRGRYEHLTKALFREIAGDNDFIIPGIKTDSVSSMRCLHWPSQAAEWPKRSRYYGWPNIATIDTVVVNGCDVVQAVHPLCKQNEWMSKHQWRLSFSRAEVTLLNSWTPVQQMVYHLLRFVLKREVFPKTDEYSPDSLKLSNYHVKTLMLWECEQKPQTWWSVESSLVRLCSSLLQKLYDCVENRCCQHYFVGNCNLLDHLEDTSFVICNSLNGLIDASVLLNWFVENYIREFAQCCPAEVSAGFEDICTTGKLQTAINFLAGFELKSSLFHRMMESIFWPEYYVLVMRQFGNIVSKPFLIHMIEATSLPLHSRHYSVAVASLHAALNISIHGLSEDLLEVLWALFNPCTPAIASSLCVESESLISIKKAIKLATLSSDRSNAMEMLHNEMSKAYLHHSFTSGIESTYQVVHVLLAVLYYKSLHYQEAIDHCKQVLNMVMGHKRDCAGTIGAEYLPQIDERVDAVFGLMMLYQRIRRNALSFYDQLQIDNIDSPALSIDLLAWYLYAQSSSMVNTESSEVSAAYRQHLCQTRRPLLSDILLFKAVEMRANETCTAVPFVEARTAKNEKSAMNTTLLVTMLEQVALEKLIAVRQLTSEQFPVVNEFEVLYAYKCGLFKECLRICRSNVSTLVCGGFQRSQPYLIAFPELLSLLDGELVSLFGIIRLLRPTNTISFLSHHPKLWSISMLTLSLYLMVQCLRKTSSRPPVQELKLIRFVHDHVFTDEVKDFLDRMVLKLCYRLLKLWSAKN